MKWSPQQQAALDKVGAWIRSGDPLFRLFGYAGTGKTTLAKHIAEGVGGPVLFAAYTGKAAHVLQKSGCPNASTLHRLLYRCREKDPQKLAELEALLDVEKALPKQDPGKIRALERKIAKLKKDLKSPHFEYNPDSDIKDAALLIVDEVSMVDEKMGGDILSYGTPVLVLGDPAQLPPIKGAGYFTRGQPDAMLEEIHRQAADSPIIRLASKVRKGGLPTVDGEQVIARRDLRLKDFPEAQIIVGRNKTRHRANAKARELRGFVDPDIKDIRGIDDRLPLAGDRLVCLRNDHDVGLLNGSIWTVVTDPEEVGPYLYLEVRAEDTESGPGLQVPAHKATFVGDEVCYWDRKAAQEFDYGYALTCHKAQGSQWDEVVIVDESSCFRRDRFRWLYTAITRAAEKVTVAR
jgi:exodeoxyribonuclease-5